MAKRGRRALRVVQPGQGTALGFVWCGAMGDLRAQGREYGHLNTADMEGKTQNSAMTWGVVVKDGLAYVNDMNNGIWVVRMEPKREDLTP